MARKKEISREKILSTAYKMVIKDGIESLTARNIAKAGHFSTQPLYLEFNSMDELRKAVFEKIAEDLRTKDLQKTFVNRPLIDLDLAYIEFSQAHVNLFKLMFVDSELGSKIISSTLIDMGIGKFKEQNSDTDYSEEKIHNIVVANWITVIGIVALLINKIATFSQKQIINVLNAQIEDAMKNDWLSTDNDLFKSRGFTNK